MTTIAIAAGEASGDYLAAGLIRALKKRLSDVRFIGIAGPRMLAAGCEARFAQEKLAVMGFAEVLRRLPEIYAIRRAFAEYLTRKRPDVMIGVDAPDFNLQLEARLKAKGIKTVHYVSPSVWAWRPERVHKIKQAVDRMLTLFPFEAAFYQRHGVAVTYVGHPLADAIEIEPDRARARAGLGLPPDQTIIGVLPGSRESEVERIAPLFCAAAGLLRRAHPDWRFAAALATPRTKARFERVARRAIPDMALRVCHGQAAAVMTAADVLMVASGTATLEALLCKRPMVVSYKMAPLTWWYMRRKIITKRYALPNHLAGRDVVCELYQDKARPPAIAAEIERLAAAPDEVARLQQEFTRIHRRLRRGANERAADAVMEVLGLEATA